MTDIEKIDQSIERLQTIIDGGTGIDIDAEKTYVTGLADELGTTIDTDPEIPVLVKFIDSVEKAVTTKDTAEYIKLFSDKAFIDGMASIKVALPDFEKEKADAVAADKKKLEDSVTDMVKSVMAQITTAIGTIPAAALEPTLKKAATIYDTDIKKNIGEIMNSVKILAKHDPNLLGKIEKTKAVLDKKKVRRSIPGKLVVANATPSTDVVTFKDLSTEIDTMVEAYQKLGTVVPVGFADIIVIDPNQAGTLKLKALFKKVTDKIAAKSTPIIDNAYKKIQTGGGLPELFARMIRTAQLLILKKNAEKLRAEQIKRRATVVAAIAAAASAQSATKPKPKPPSNTNDYLEPLMSLIMYKVGILNNYDKDFFAYCQKLGLDIGATLAIFFTDKRKDCQDILKNILPYNLTAIMNVMRLKKLAAEQKFRQNYRINDDLHMRVLMEKQTIWG